MVEHQDQLQVILSYLKAWEGSQILITKEEEGDIDQTVIDLHRLDFENYDNAFDDYLPQAALQLAGPGQTLGETDSPLPYAQFDIPVDHLSEVQCSSEEIFIKTDRGTYMLSPIRRE
ncbi:hypothetical protein JOD43_000524 [Pullulanibacillus pueri]|uniref:Uncharacterized protein n=1 Tax=Pullulanibacillus pueri TaxID=1437324 RepID=A0A8J2ZSH8_9BACL|nr:hypothetical protein [Pullulanibacillus pueri]MBM7680365.1 hypothetical protein [Pullulanibacillus pueri]GGH75434.1 hypothetical protein GCM10007096_04660 [Pullulanibacillus pueri]